MSPVRHPSHLVKPRSVRGAFWRRLFSALLLMMLALPLLGMTSPSSHKQAAKTPKKNAGSAYDVIAAVNNLRQANGLPPFQINGALMAAAQAHSEYQAASGSASHTGRGGSDPKSRAIAAGYGGGAAVSVIENIYSGMNASPQQAVQWWQNDGPHLATLLSTRHQDVGAGVATSGSVVYYTLDVGSIVGSNPGTNGSGNAPGGAPPASQSAPVAPTAVAFYPVVLATPNPDGSIVHIVQPGQALWNIAASYKIALSELLALNSLNENSYIFPGDKILIKPAFPSANSISPGGTASPEVNPTGESSTPTSTVAPETPEPDISNKTPMSEPDQTYIATGPIPSPKSETTASKPDQTSRPASGALDPLILLIAGMVSIGTALVLLGYVLKRSG